MPPSEQPSSGRSSLRSAASFAIFPYAYPYRLRSATMKMITKTVAQEIDTGTASSITCPRAVAMNAPAPLP